MKLHSLQEFPCPFPSDILYDGKGRLEIEFGVGKGRYMSELARLSPDVRLIGVEKSKTWFECARERLEKLGLNHVLLIHSYVDPILESYLPTESVDRFHVLFPDPWPKRRQHGRRLFQDRTMKLVWKALKPKGEILFGTDHLDYFADIQKLFERSLNEYFQFETLESLACTSNFQAKYVKEGRALRFSRMTKVGDYSSMPHRAVEIQAAIDAVPSYPRRPSGRTNPKDPTSRILSGS